MRHDRWWSGRAAALHSLLAFALPACGYAAYWQIGRALHGNPLSWLYVFEWPAFGVLSAWLWWVLITGPQASRIPCARTDGVGDPAPRRQGAVARAELLRRRRGPLAWSPSAESPALADYNAWLADLAAGGHPRRPGRRRPGRADAAHP